MAACEVNEGLFGFRVMGGSDGTLAMRRGVMKSESRGFQSRVTLFVIVCLFILLCMLYSFW